MQIIIPKKVRKFLMALLVVALLSIGFLAIRPALTTRFVPTPTITTSDSRAAVSAVIAYYNLDYSEDIELWIARVCATTTEAGCRIIRGYFASTVKNMVKKHQIQTRCTAGAVRLVSETNQKRIWQVRVSLDHPWPDLKDPTQDVYVEVSEVGDKWLMNRFLFEQEVERLVTPTH